VASTSLTTSPPPWHQTTLPLAVDPAGLPAVATTVAQGAIFTRPEVVAFILDLVGYTIDRPLHRLRLLEPAIGQGDFLLPAIDRLLCAWRADPSADLAALQQALCGVELHAETFIATRQLILDRLIAQGFSAKDALALADCWLIQGDFLLVALPEHFDLVVGNPPYVRQELIPAALMAIYRARYQTISDRADIYIPFLERSLSLLAPGGQLGCICADRWMKNRYGARLRALVAEHFYLKVYVDMVDTPAFQSAVIAYPAITVIARGRGSLTRVAHRPEISAQVLAQLAAQLTAEPLLPEHRAVRALTDIVLGPEPWIFESPDQLALVRRLERDFPLLEDVGCNVGIGVATGLDTVFIGRYADLDVEDDRKLPLAMTKDIASGAVHWRGLGVVNPFADDGGLVDLGQYPRLRQYLTAHRPAIAARHIAQKHPAAWYRTIDRIYPALAATPKLLIPDIKGAAHIVYEPGRLYPHHNLYYITSAEWDLRALQAVLRSGIASLFVAIYSTRMRGGFLRFQAQYLRRIRLPAWSAVPAALRLALISATERNDRAAAKQAVAALYGLSLTEQDVLSVGEE
jgi:Eco57I restriction-modification methylase/TaqI-like C-terminal specificity domain